MPAGALLPARAGTAGTAGGLAVLERAWLDAAMAAVADRVWADTGLEAGDPRVSGVRVCLPVRFLAGPQAGPRGAVRDPACRVYPLVCVWAWGVEPEPVASTRVFERRCPDGRWPRLGTGCAVCVSPHADLSAGELAAQVHLTRAGQPAPVRVHVPVLGDVLDLVGVRGPAAVAQVVGAYAVLTGDGLAPGRDAVRAAMLLAL